MIARHILDDFGSLKLNMKRRVSNLVLMGEGEPLYNYRQVKKALEILTDEDGCSIGKRRVTLSTSGVVPLIKKVRSELGVNLAVSLHAPTDDVRTEIMAINKTYPLRHLMDACREYSEDPCGENGFVGSGRKRRITFEYVMLKGVNDSVTQAQELCSLLKPQRFPLVNLIPFNPWPGSPYESSSSESVIAFAAELERRGQAVTIRWPRGQDISAACGQLKALAAATENFEDADPTVIESERRAAAGIA
jgi:23S rRNA (adenine2503-C2)-methyltransferase